MKRIAAASGDAIPDWLAHMQRATDTRVPDAHFVVAGDAAGSKGSRHLGLVAHTQVLAWLPRR